MTHFLLFGLGARRSAWPELLQFTPLSALSRECLHFEGGKLNRLDGQSCCAAVLTATLRHTAGGTLPRCILHVKRVWSTKLSIFCTMFLVVVLAVCSSSHSMGRGGFFLDVSTH